MLLLNLIVAIEYALPLEARYRVELNTARTMYWTSCCRTTNSSACPVGQPP
jgi:hypothetical protein